MATITSSISNVSRQSGEENAIITFVNNTVCYVSDTIKINNRLSGGFLSTTDPITIVGIINPNTVVVTGLSEEDASDFVITDDEIGANAVITVAYPQGTVS